MPKQAAIAVLRRGGRLMLPAVVLAAGLPLIARSPASGNPSIPLNYAAREMTTPVTVDGKLDEWQGADPVLLVGEAHWEAGRQGENYGGPADAAARFHAAWDAGNLYLAIEAYDNDLRPPGDPAKMLEGDCIVIAVDARNDDGQGYREDDSEMGFAYGVQGAMTWRWFPTERAGPVYSAKVAVVREMKPGPLPPGTPPLKLTYEIAIPWFELPGVRHETGKAFGFDLSFNDADFGRRHGWLQWTAGVMGIKDPSRFGNVHLVAPRAAPPPSPEETPAAPPERPASPAPAGISFDQRSFIIDGRGALLYSGGLHYFRCPKAEWRDRLAKMKAAGLNCVSTYVPWNWHERRENQADLADLDEFLGLAESMGLYVIVQPGPYIGADWSGGGLPPWLAAKPLRYRSADPQFLAWCQHWFSEVMPVIARHQIGKGGGVIMVQLENELRGDIAEDRRLMAALHDMARSLGIEVPLIASSTPAARENADHAMADIIDGVVLQLGWDAAQAEQALAEASEQENTPTLVTALPTGEPLPARTGSTVVAGEESHRTAALTFAALEAGADLINYSIAYGGTNFGYWGAADIATTYDCDAPIAEHGELTAPYYAAKGVGDFLASFGPMLARSWRLPQGAAFADDTQVSVVERISGESAFIFLRVSSQPAASGTAARHVRLTYTDPLDGQQVTIPAAGRITLPDRGARILVAGIPLSHGRLDYCTSEIVGPDIVADRQLLLVRGEPGDAGEARLRLDAPPAIAGDPVSTAWDAARRTLTVSYRFRETEQHVVLDTLELVIASYRRALHSWTVAAGTDTVRLVSDAYFLREAVADAQGLAMTLDLQPGEASFTGVMPRTPLKVSIDGKPAAFTYDPVTRVVRFRVSTGPFDERRPRHGGVLGKVKDFFAADTSSLAQSFSRARATIDPLVGDSGWQQVQLRPLHELAVFDAGYTVYRATFDPGGRRTMSVEAYAADPKLVYINERLVPSLSIPATSCSGDVSQFLRTGENVIDVVYHNLGWFAQGPRMDELKGLRAVSLLAPATRSAGAPPATTAPTGEQGEGASAAGAEAQAASESQPLSLVQWRMWPRLRGEVAGFHLPQYDDRPWNILSLGEWARASSALRGFDGIMWYRIIFSLPQRQGWDIAWKLRMDAAEQTMIYLNGQLLGKHFAGWPQTEFYLPQAWLRPGAKNLLAFAVRSGESGGGLKAVTIEPYPGAVVRPTRIEIRY